MTSIDELKKQLSEALKPLAGEDQAVFVHSINIHNMEFELKGVIWNVPRIQNLTSELNNQMKKTGWMPIWKK